MSSVTRGDAACTYGLSNLFYVDRAATMNLSGYPAAVQAAVVVQLKALAYADASAIDDAIVAAGGFGGGGGSITIATTAPLTGGATGTSFTLGIDLGDGLKTTSGKAVVALASGSNLLFTGVGGHELAVDTSLIATHAYVAANYADIARSIDAGTGLTGGGDLSADRTLAVAFGTSGATACVGNDARLSDARAPTAGSVVAASFGAGAFGTSGTTACVGNDSRLSNARAPSTAGTNGGVMVYAGGAWASTAAGTAGFALLSNGASAPTWQAIQENTAFRARVCSKQANLTLSGAQTIDGVSCVAGDVVHCEAQTTTANNGPWVVAAGAWARPAWFANAAVVLSNHAVHIREGTLYAGATRRNNNAADVTVGTTTPTYENDARTLTMADNTTSLRGTRGAVSWNFLSLDSSGNTVIGDTTIASTIILKSGSAYAFTIGGTTAQYSCDATTHIWGTGTSFSMLPFLQCTGALGIVGQRENDTGGIPVAYVFRGAQPSSSSSDTGGSGITWRAGVGRGNKVSSRIVLGGAIPTTSGATLQTARDSFAAGGEWVSNLGATRQNRTPITAAYTVLVTDFYVGITNIAAPFTITLPSIASLNLSVNETWELELKDEKGVANGTTLLVTIAVSGGGTIDGGASALIDAAFKIVKVRATSNGWFLR